MDRFGISFEFAKAAPTGRYVRGWAYVTHDENGPVVDWSGQQIEDMDVLRKAAHEFISDTRIAKVLHKGDVIGDFVESIIVDDDFAKAMGATTKLRGWWVGMRVHDDDIAKRVRTGELRMFSIGGRGTVEKVK